MVVPFRDMIHAQTVLKHRLLTETLRKRHFLAREATNNKHAAIPQQVQTSFY